MKKDKINISELRQTSERVKLTVAEWILAPVLSAVAAVWAFPYIGTAIGWDDLYYMDVSQHTTPQATILNRYVHIYIQKFFFWLAGNPMTGTRIYWCVQFFVTLTLVYWCARLLAGKKGWLIGLVGAAIFCSQSYFGKYSVGIYSGCTDADLTVMMFLTAGIFVLLAFRPDISGHRHIIIMVLGLLFFAAMKSKETAICMAVLFLALGKDAAGVRNFNRFVKDTGWVFAGMAAGSVILMIFDGIILGDFLFSVRPANIHQLFAFNFGQNQPITSTSWLAHLMQQPMAAAFLFYLFVGSKFNHHGSEQNMADRTKLYIWSIPLLLLIFIIYTTMMQRLWPVVARYFAPAIPVICIFAAQFFRFDISGALSLGKSGVNIPKMPAAIIIVAAAFVIACSFTQKMGEIAVNLKIENPHEFYVNYILPAAIAAVLIAAAVTRKRGLIALFICWLGLFMIICLPLTENIMMLKQRVVAQQSKMRYLPYSVFKDDIKIEKTMRILVSKSFYAQYKMLGRNYIPHCWMFNVFFNQKLDQSQFIDGTADDILKGGYDYGFVTQSDWQTINKKPEFETLMRNYTFRIDPQTKFVLLKKR